MDFLTLIVLIQRSGKYSDSPTNCYPLENHRNTTTRRVHKHSRSLWDKLELRIPLLPGPCSSYFNRGHGDTFSSQVSQQLRYNKSLKVLVYNYLSKLFKIPLRKYWRISTIQSCWSFLIGICPFFQAENWWQNCLNDYKMIGREIRTSYRSGWLHFLDPSFLNSFDYISVKTHVGWPLP